LVKQVCPIGLFPKIDWGWGEGVEIRLAVTFFRRMLVGKFAFGKTRL